MNNIKKHIKDGNFARAYLLYGEEKYLVRTYKNLLKIAICNDDTMNFSHYEGKDVDINDIRDTAQTMPFFAERKLILIENSGMFKNSSESMNEIVQNAPETTYFIFVENEIDKRNRLFKTLSSMGYVCEMKLQTEEALTSWALRIFSEAGKKITGNDMKLFMSIAGPEMDNIYNEAMKLTAYCLERDVITAEDITAVCSPRTVDRVFDMIQAMALGDTDEVMRLYGDLLSLKEPPMKILALIGRQFSQLLAVRKLMETESNSRIIAERLGIRPFFAGKYISQAKRYSVSELENAVNDCIETEYGVKNGRLEDKYGVELLIIKYSTQS